MKCVQLLTLDTDPNLQNYDAPCVVCFVPRPNIRMFPAQISCPSGWTLEYSGYLLSNRADYHNSGGVCIDTNADYLDGSQADTDGELLLFVTASCGDSFLPCGPYKHGLPITCAVCTY